MKQFLLATALIAVPVALFSAYEHYVVPPADAAQAQSQTKGLGDLADFKAITKDIQKIAATGNFTAAEKRATDFETEWDDKEASLRPVDPEAWGNIDAAADAVFKSLRKGTPTTDKVNSALADLQMTLDKAGAVGGKTGTQAFVAGIAVTDTTGHAVPCEDLINQLKAASAKAGISAEKQAKAGDFMSKALERCNADDDQRADAFSAQGIALLTQ